jgi:aerobic carbon-monoxide dehydrogenase medium subunit
VLGLGAVIVTNKRKLSAEEYFQGMFTTALEEGEIITKVVFPIPSKASYAKFPNPASRYAIVGVMVAKRGSEVRVAVTGAGNDGVFRWDKAEAALKGRFAAKSLDGMVADAKAMNADIHADAAYRAHLVGVMARRAVTAATGK